MNILCLDSGYLISLIQDRHDLDWVVLLSIAAHAPERVFGASLGRLSRGPAAAALPVAPARPDRRSLPVRSLAQGAQPLGQRLELPRQCVDGLGVPPVALRQFAA